MVSADEGDFPHIDFSKYGAVEKKLFNLGYIKISDLELVNLSNDPSSLFKKTLIRTFTSQNGEIVAACYQLRPRLGRRLILLFQGLLSFRLIAAPLFFISTIPARFLIDF
jgi:hypothetical protein